jgi:hypothetical protein
MSAELWWNDNDVESPKYSDNRPDHDQHHCYHQAPTVKPQVATAVVVAPDDGHEDARNMLSCI